MSKVFNLFVEHNLHILCLSIVKLVEKVLPNTVFVGIFFFIRVVYSFLMVIHDFLQFCVKLVLSVSSFPFFPCAS